MNCLCIFIALVQIVVGFHPKLSYKSSFINYRIYSKKPLPEKNEIDVSTVSSDKSYDADSITVLKGLEPVRKRPGMYIGSTGSKGLHHLVYEAVDNSVDEALAGHCTDISVKLLPYGMVEVVDNGRGIPCTIHPATGKSTLETVLCVLHAGGKFGGEQSGYKVSGGLHGVGISVVNALSAYLRVEVVRDGLHYMMEFAEGQPITPAILIRSALPHETRGTKILFQPDPKIFKTTIEYEFDTLAARFDELAYLHAGLRIDFLDTRQPFVDTAAMNTTISSDQLHVVTTDGDELATNSILLQAEELHQQNDTNTMPSVSSQQSHHMIYKHDGGIQEMVSMLCQGKSSLHPTHEVLHIHQSKKNITVEVALQWSADQYVDSITGFVNGIRTNDGGSHVDGLKAGLQKAILSSAKTVRINYLLLFVVCFAF